MSDSHMLDCLEEILTAVRAHATPTKNFTLSDDPDNRVVVVDDPPVSYDTLPCVLFAIDKAVPAYGPQATLHDYDNLYMVSFWCAAPATDDTATARIYAAVRLAHDVIETIEDAHRDVAYPTLRTCTTVLPALESVYGGGKNAPAGAGTAYCTLTIRTDRHRGI